MSRYTVTTLTQEVAELFARRYPRVEVEGEVAQVTTPASGHAYLTLRDADASMAAVVWRNTWKGLDFKPRRGDKVVARGRLGVYPQRGSYQLYVTALARAGEGDLAKQIAERRARLEADGLLDPRRKRELPRFPRRVGVATSLTGAALQDFLEVSAQRFPAARILVAGCTVQGVSAPSSVVQAVELLVDDGRAEVIVVTRGGGSKEDLLAFQDEGLARYLAHCPVPVCSAVGHQIDTTLADLVADVVAPTPTAAAVAVLPDGPAWRQRVDEAALSLASTVERRLRAQRQVVAGLQARLRHPGQKLADIRRRADEASARMERIVGTRLAGHRREVAALEPRLHRALAQRVAPARSAVDRLQDRLARAMAAQLGQARREVQTLEARATALSPAGVLQRGYAVVVGPSGVVTAADQVAVGQSVQLRLAAGELSAQVTGRRTASGPGPSPQG